MNSIEDALFENAEELYYESKSKLDDDVKHWCDKGVLYFYVAQGNCVIKPKVNPLSDCTLYIKLLTYSGEFLNYKIIYKEVQHEALSFE